MSRLTLEFLGTPGVRHAGQLLTFRTRKALALLIYLAVEGGMHTREKLTALLWPESDTVQGRATLRNTLAFLRQALGGVAESGKTAHLIVERDALGFDFTSAFDLDVRDLETASTLANTPPALQSRSANSHRTLTTELLRSATLYRSDFLEGFSLSDAPDFDDWTAVQREHAHRCMNEIFARLAQLLSERGELHSAIEVVTRWLTLNPLNEDAHARLMRLHLIAGNRDAALRAFDIYRRVLAKDLGAEPAPEIQALAARIRVEAPPHPRPAPELQREAVLLPLLEPPLVGRGTEHRQLVELYQSACRGRTQVVILEGEAGIGKTRLATEFLNWAAAQNADVLRGRAFETGGRLPYQPLVDALRSRLERENRGEKSGKVSPPTSLLSPVWLGELSLLLPELRDRYPGLPAPTAEETLARTRLFEAVTRLGKGLAGQSPLLLFIDDIQWADSGSLDLLHYASRRWAESFTPVMVLLTFRAEGTALQARYAVRPEQDRENSVLGEPHLQQSQSRIRARPSSLTLSQIADWLAQLDRNLPVTSLRLGPLSEEDTIQLAQALGYEEPSKGAQSTAQELFGQWLFRETGGQLFFLVETLKSLLERGYLTPHLRPDGVWAIDVEATMRQKASLRGNLPTKIRELIVARLARLTPTAFALLAADAVLGQAFSFERLCQVAGLSENEGLPALDEVLASQLLREEPGSALAPGTILYIFVHDKIREVIYTEARDARRRIFHRRALEILQAARAPAAELAHHARAAGLSEPTFRYSFAAGEEAMQLFSLHDAITHYERAERALEELLEGQNGITTAFTAELQQLSTQLGRAYELSNKPEKAYKVYQAMLAFARQASLPTMECAALNRLATLAAQDKRDVERARALLQEALQVATVSDDRAGLAETEWNLALINYYAFEPAAALVHGERALLQARDLNQRDLIARCLNVIAHARSELSRWEEIEAPALEAKAHYAALSNRVMEADSLALVAGARIHCGQLQSGVAAGRAARAISLEIENTWGQVYAAFHLTTGLVDCGDYTEAVEVAKQAVAAARTLSFNLLLFLSLVKLGDVYRALFLLEAARAAHQEALVLNESIGSRLFTEMIAAELCADCVRAGEWTEALAYARQALAVRDSTTLYGGLGRHYEIAALVRGGDREQAVEDLRRFGERIGNNPRYRIPYLRALSTLAQREPQTGKAFVHLQEAARLAEEIGLPGELWQIELTRGKLHQVRGEETQARTAFGRAATTVQALANRIPDDQLRAAFLSAPLCQSLASEEYLLPTSSSDTTAYVPAFETRGALGKSRENDNRATPPK